jgi:peptide/nickel transport system substrate-binding protein
MRMLAKAAAVLLAAGAGLMAAPASAQKSADTLRVYWRDQVTDIDPYFNSLRTGLIVAHHAWDGLVYRDPNGYVMKPLLAKSWKWTDDTTLEFELQPDAKFHNGDPVTAADVVYTIKVITDPKSGISVPSNYSWIASAEAIDEHHVRIKTKTAFPAALEYIAFVTPIYPMAYREKVGRDGYRNAPIGAGPYRITHIDGVNEIDMERFDGYYPESSKGRPAIRKIVIKEVTDATNELTALLGGQADWIYQYNPDQFDKINAMPNLTAMRQEAFRILFLQLESAVRNGKPTPLTDVRVRRAIAYALDRKTFADKLVQGGSRVPDAPCYFTQFGCDQAAAVHYGYDPAKARALLAEAGYANGFDTEIVNGNLLTSWTGAIQGYLGAVGIRAKVTTLQAVAGITRAESGDAPLYMSSWGSYSVNDVSAFLPYFFTGSSDDFSQDPEVKALLIKGGSVNDPEARKAAYSKAIQRITDQAYMIPIATFTTTYAVSKQLNFQPWADEMPRWFLSSWK